MALTAALTAGLIHLYSHGHEPPAHQHEEGEEAHSHEDAHEGHGHGHAHTGEEAEENSVELTADQLESVGIALGTVGLKQLEDAVRVSGTIRVPNSGKAMAVSLYPGVVRTLTVQMGDHVRKGQVLATIQNPQFIQLQEQYLTTRVNDSLAHQEMERQKTLQAGNAGAWRNYENARAALSKVHAELASLRRQIELMGIKPEDVSQDKLQDAIQVLAPLTGTVAEVFATVGGVRRRFYVRGRRGGQQRAAPRPAGLRAGPPQHTRRANRAFPPDQ